jgi:hypothetical protein
MLQLTHTQAKNETEEVRRKMREELAMAEIKANGLRDLIQQLRQEKQVRAAALSVPPQAYRFNNNNKHAYAGRLNSITHV